MKKAFVTGGTGFVGHYLITELLKKNYYVYALSRKGSEIKLEEIDSKKLKIVDGDLLNSESYDNILDSVNFVFHFAALFRLEAPKEELMKVNVTGTERLLKACIGKKHIKKIICCSTIGVYKSDKNKMGENHPLGQFINDHYYEYSKVEMEKICAKYHKEYNLPIIIIRPAAVYGVGSKYFFFDIFNLVKDGKIKAYPGPCNNMVHLVHVEDVARAAVHLSINGLAGESYNIADDNPLTMREAIDIVLDALGKTKPKITLPSFLSKIASKAIGVSDEFLLEMNDYRCESNDKLKKTGFRFKHPKFREGIKEYIKNTA
jgi:nucleoside-diphosphate-sugar epimerase